MAYEDREREDSERFDRVKIRDVTVKKETDKALLCRIDGEET